MKKRNSFELQATELTKEFLTYMRRKYGTGKTTRQSAMFITKYSNGIEINGWHGTGTGNRNYGNLNIIFSVYVPDGTFGGRLLTDIDGNMLGRMAGIFGSGELAFYTIFLGHTKNCLEAL